MVNGWHYTMKRAKNHRQMAMDLMTGLNVLPVAGTFFKPICWAHRIWGKHPLTACPVLSSSRLTHAQIFLILSIWILLCHTMKEIKIIICQMRNIFVFTGIITGIPHDNRESKTIYDWSNLRTNQWYNNCSLPQPKYIDW